MPTITMPQTGVLGIPAGTKEAGKRVDFKPDDFALAIETKGYLAAWERAGACPCAPIASQSSDPDPTCPLCGGRGFIYFGPQGGVQADRTADYVLDECQQALVDDNGALLIRAMVVNITAVTQPWEQTGKWVSGTMMATVRAENKIGYYDRITLLDPQIVYTEVVEYSTGAQVPLRYRTTGVNLLRSVDRVFEPEADYIVTADGELQWMPGKEPGAVRLSAHYLCHPAFIVVEHPHVIRMTSRKLKTKNLVTPTGNPRDLPLQAMLRYDFLVQS